jgi:hypothetical protein
MMLWVIRACRRICRLRSDENGSVLLLSGMMVFLVTMFAVLALDTSEAIHRRITAQNAADAAADAAALWQARGCNLLQHLNNLHYALNSVAATVELTQFGACIAAGPARIIGNVYGGWGELAARVLCAWCDLAPKTDQAQSAASDVILNLQSAVETAIPWVVFYAANDAARGSGADPLAEVLAQYSSDIISRLGLSVNALQDAANQPGLSKTPIYAYPLNTGQGYLPPDNVSLHVHQERGKAPPWVFVQHDDLLGWMLLGMAKAGAALGQCPEFPKYNNFGWGGDEEPESYYWGNPGYMTWIAGKKRRPELAGLGKLRWLHGGALSSQEETVYWLQQRSVKMYSGPVTAEAQPVQIPAFLAFASSQVEGDPVVARGKANARGTLIRVYLPWFGDAGAPFIWH